MNPQADSAPPILVTELPTASLFRRVSCWLYEGMLLFGVIFIAGYLFGALSQTRHAMHNRLGLQVFVFLVLALYFTFFWHKGQTLAMKTWHLKIVTLDGQALSQKQGLLRFFYAWIWFVPPLLIASVLGWSSLQGLGAVMIWIPLWASLSKLHSDKQFWHDHWARTRVVDARSQISPTAPTIPT
jgi:uncharacterized RDD family membrane protein YckC